MGEKQHMAVDLDVSGLVWPVLVACLFVHLALSSYYDHELEMQKPCTGIHVGAGGDAEQ